MIGYIVTLLASRRFALDRAIRSRLLQSCSGRSVKSSIQQTSLKRGPNSGSRRNGGSASHLFTNRSFFKAEVSRCSCYGRRFAKMKERTTNEHRKSGSAINIINGIDRKGGN